jgi:formamidopyrimidine-DNA glycosylase
MAEGHAVARWADALQALVGETVTEVEAPRRWQARAAGLAGATLNGVRAHGKHLVLTFSVPWVIHAHAMQYGSWQIGTRGITPRKEPRYVRLHLVTASHEAFYFHGPVMEVLSLDEFSAYERFHSLGPDLLHEGFDTKAAARRVRATGTREIGDVIVDQRVVAGIGNIYKSEGLFLAGIHPWTPARLVSVDQLQTMFGELVPLMQEGRRRFGAIVTVPGDVHASRGVRNWVYRRRGAPCLKCGTPIEMGRQGTLKRMVFFCPQCQRTQSVQRKTRRTILHAAR